MNVAIFHKVEPVIYALSTGFMTATSFLLGGWTMSLSVLTCLMVLDILTGTTKGFFTGGLRSRTMMEGLTRKFGVFVIIILAHFMDVLKLSPEGMEGLYKTIVISFYCVVEILSILENLALMNVPLPGFIVNRLKQVRELLDTGNNPVNQNQTKPNESEKTNQTNEREL